LEAARECAAIDAAREAAQARQRNAWDSYLILLGFTLYDNGAPIDLREYEEAHGRRIIKNKGKGRDSTPICVDDSSDNGGDSSMKDGGNAGDNDAAGDDDAGHGDARHGDAGGMELVRVARHSVPCSIAP
jgi:hypothetical protein